MRTKWNAQKDVFEDLCDLLKCEYISDLAAIYQKDARRMCAFIRLDCYPLSQLKDLYTYLYGETRDFSDSHTAEEAFVRAYEATR